MQVSRLNVSGRYHNEKCTDKMREEKQNGNYYWFSGIYCVVDCDCNDWLREITAGHSVHDFRFPQAPYFRSEERRVGKEC